MFNRKPQIILNNFGISTSLAGFHNWSAINYIEVYCKKTAKGGKSYFLNYTCENKKTSVEITYFDISQLKLEKLIRVYQYRF